MKQSRYTPFAVVFVVAVMLVLSAGCGPAQVQTVATTIAKTQAAITPTSVTAPMSASTPNLVATPPFESTPTLMAEEAYVGQIQPALDSLAQWLAGSVADYEKTLLLAVNDKNEIITTPTDKDIRLWIALQLGWQYPDLMSHKEALEKYLAPAADQVAQSGFEVMATFNAMTPPASAKTAHDQIVMCVRYKVELTAEINKSIMGTFFTPKTLNEKDPCNLLDASIRNLKNYVVANKK